MGKFGFVDGLKVGAKGFVVSIIAGLGGAIVYWLAMYVFNSIPALGWLIAIAGFVFWLWLWGLVAFKLWKWK